MTVAAMVKKKKKKKITVQYRLGSMPRITLMLPELIWIDFL